MSSFDPFSDTYILVSKTHPISRTDTMRGSPPQALHQTNVFSTNGGPKCNADLRAQLAVRRSGIIGVMADVTQILSQIEAGDPSAAEELLPLVYDELRRLAAQRLAREKPGQTLQATALVHEAYLRLVDESARHWDSRGHFFAAAAESMRRILVDIARKKKSKKAG